MPTPTQSLPLIPRAFELLKVVLICLFLPFWIVFIVSAYLILTFFLHLRIWFRWSRSGRDILFVYSNSPIWKEYIEENLLPHLGDRAVILNWSERKQWPRSLEKEVFRHFGGDKEFNPMAVVLRPFRRSHVYRFWSPFRDYKQGCPEALKKMEEEFFSKTGIDRPDIEPPHPQPPK